MKEYQADRHIGFKKKIFLSKAKRNLLLNIMTITKASKLEFKNAIRSYKKAKRQQIRREIKNMLDEEDMGI